MNFTVKRTEVGKILFTCGEFERCNPLDFNCTEPNLPAEVCARDQFHAYLGDGHTHRQGDYQSTVAAGLSWLKKMQRPDGNLFDIDEFGRSPTYYAHSMATIALCEAYAMTADRTLRLPARNAVKFLIESQHPTNGGWKYQKLTEVTNLNLKCDLSVTGWALMALHSARLCDFDVSEDVWIRA